MAEIRPDGDRLPWLDPVGPRKVATGPRAAVRGLTIVVVVLALALAGTLSLLLLRDRGMPANVGASAPPQRSAKVELPIAPAPRPAPVIPTAPAPLPATPPPAIEKPAASTPKPARVIHKARPKHRRAVRRHHPKRKAAVHRKARKTVAPAPRPSVIQLGAFNTPRQAEIAWQSAVRDYSYLGTLPKVVSPVRVGPRRRLYYRLRVGAPSHQHAVLICRAVRAMQRSCIVTR